MSAIEQQDALREFGRPGGIADRMTNELFPDDPQIEQEQIEVFKSLDESDQREAVKRGRYLFGAFLAILHNVLAVMVHGERMTSLVPKALSGDVE